ncbi:MAG: endonuclease, partial [Deltaproteobacteria bacterium]
MKKLFKIIFGFICILVLGFVCLVGYATLSDYQPDPTTLVFENQKAKPIAGQTNFRLLIWNIGYGGLSRDMDFFYDGGKQVRTSKKNVEKNI